MMTRLRGLAAVVLLLGILLGPPALLAVAGTLPGHVPSWADVDAALRAPDDGTIALTAITVIGWGAWLILAGAVLLEVAARVRGATAPRLPHGMRWAQGAARALVAAAAVTFSVAAPSLAHAAPTVATAAAAVAPGTTTPHPPAAAPDPTTPEPDPAAAAPAGPAGWVEYEVQRGDTLWGIAEARLGAGEEYRQIAAANRGVLGDTPGFLIPGWVLTVPPVSSPAEEAEAAAGQEGTVVVVAPGDTLSGIAADQLGDPDRYPEIVAATAGVTQPDGARLRDADEIRPGWRVIVPAPPASPSRPAPATAADPSPTPPVPDPVPADPPAAPITARTIAPAPAHSLAVPPPAAAAPTPAPAAPVPAAATATREAEGPASASWTLTGLTGAGTVLAGALLMVLRRRRQAQFRARRPGRAAAPTEPALIAVEQAVTTFGAPAAATIETVDAVLRALAHRQGVGGRPLPQLAALEVSDASITAHLAAPGELPAPWAAVDATQKRWACPLDAAPDTHGGHDDGGAVDLSDQPAPWPLLVTIGSSSDGHHWLLNAEAYPVLHVHGPHRPAEDFVRSVVAELAVSPWSRDLRIDCIGLLPELGPLSPGRLRHHATAGAVLPDATVHAQQQADRAVDAGVDDLPTARAHQDGDELWTAHLIVTHPETGDAEDLEHLGQVLTDQRSTGSTLMLTGEDTTIPGATAVVLSEAGLTLPDFGLTLTPVALTAQEGAGCAALMAGRLLLSDTPMPVPTQTSAAWHELANVDGSLRADLVLDRTRTPEEEAGGDPGESEAAVSLLPSPDAAYLTVAATTADDLAVLAPRVPTSVQTAVEGADPGLDADVAAWTSQACDLPRLTVLGPVRARTNGDPYAVTERKAYYTEVMAWLALHPAGGTSDQLADAFGITANRVRVDVKAVRDWLGVNPRTGTKHLPDARKSAAGRAQGRGIYQVEGLLTDLDLFRRLRVRGQARGGPDGMRDLATALTLVSGRPFTGLRDHGWSWLFEGDRIDEHMVYAIVDVAHLVVTDALERGDTTLARAAADVAVHAAPWEDTPKLDLAAIARAEGRSSVAEAIIRDDICNRSDDPGLPPTELPPRTSAILAARVTAKAS